MDDIRENEPDPFFLEVYKNALDTIADQMALILMRTGAFRHHPRFDGLLDGGVRCRGTYARAGPDDGHASRQLL